MKKLQVVFLSSLFVLLAACGGPTPTTSEPTIEQPQALSTTQSSSSFLIKNTNNSSLSFSIQVENSQTNPQQGNWFTVNPKSGTIDPNDQREITLTLKSNLNPGVYSSILTVNYAGGSTQVELTGRVDSVGTNVTIQPPQPLSTAQETTSFLIENTSDASLSFNITAQNAPSNPQPGDWFTVDPRSGTIPGNEQRSVTLTLQPNLKAGTYTSTLTVNYPGGSTPFEVMGTVGGGAAGGFTLETDGFTNSLSPGGEVRVPVTISRSGSFTGAVTLEVFGAPDGVSGRFEPNPAAGTESTLVVTTQNSVAAGMYSLSVRGKSGSSSASTKVDVNVVGTTTEPTFSLALSPASLSAEAGKTVQTTVTVNKTASFSNNVSLSASGAPNGVTVSFDPAATNSTSKVSVKVGGGVAAGNYTLTIMGSGGGKMGSTKLGLTVVGKTSGAAGRITGTARTDNAKISLTPTPVTKTAPRDLQANVQDRPAYVPGQLLVQYRDGLALQADLTLQTDEKTQSEAVQEAYGLSLLRAGTPSSPSLVQVAVGVNLEAVARRLEQDPRVAYAEPNYYIYAQSVPNDPETGKLWNMPVSGLPVAWSLKNSAPNVTVAVLDTGIQTSHTDLQGIFVGGYDFCANSNCAQTDTNPQPDSTSDTHGTHVTGTLAAVGNNGKGVAGVLYGGAKIVPVKVFYQASFTTADALAQAVRWAAGVQNVKTNDGKTLTNPNPAKIINLSLGTPNQSTTLEDAVKEAQAMGALLVAAAGNVGGNSLFYPARYSGVLAVGSVNSDFGRSCFSNYGSGLDIMAAGGDGFVQNSACSGRNNEAILSTFPGNDYGYEAGTSMATPVVAGVAALVLAQNPGFSAADVTNQLKKTAYFDAATMTANQYGAGVVRADSAFGFPGPGDSVSVSASGAGSAVATATLKVNGESTPFTLDNLAAGSYTVEAATGNAQRPLAATQTVKLAAGESKSVTLQLEP